MSRGQKTVSRSRQAIPETVFVCGLGLLAVMEGDERTEWICALEDIIWAVCDEYTWCLPAHLGGNSLMPGAEDRHRESIDLFAAETAYTLAELISRLGERLSPIVAARAAREIRERVLRPICVPGASYGWEKLGNNWAAVCGRSVGAAAVYILRDPGQQAPVLKRLLDTMECYLGGFGEDGACTEGVGYWDYGFAYFTGSICSMPLKSVRGAAIHSAKLKRIVRGGPGNMRTGQCNQEAFPHLHTRRSGGER